MTTMARDSKGTIPTLVVTNNFLTEHMTPSTEKKACLVLKPSQLPVTNEAMNLKTQTITASSVLGHNSKLYSKMYHYTHM